MTTTPSVDYATRAQRAAEERLRKGDEIMDIEEGDLGDPDSEAYRALEKAYEGMAGPYDGCETCIVREVLDAAWPILEEAALAERIEKLDLQPGDTVMLRPHRELNPEGARVMAKNLAEVLPDGVKGIILAPDMDINVVPAEARSHEYECKCLVTGIDHGICQVCGRSAEEHD